MSKILEQIKTQLEQAVKSKDEQVVSNLRFLLSVLHNEEIAKRGPLSDGEVLAVIQGQVKKNRESIEAFGRGGREDLVQKEEKEKAVLEAFLPAQMSEEEIREVVKKAIASGAKDFAHVMGQVMGELKGQAEGAVVAKIVREELQSG